MPSSLPAVSVLTFLSLSTDTHTHTPLQFLGEFQALGERRVLSWKERWEGEGASLRGLAMQGAHPLQELPGASAGVTGHRSPPQPVEAPSLPVPPPGGGGGGNGTEATAEPGGLRIIIQGLNAFHIPLQSLRVTLGKSLTSLAKQGGYPCTQPFPQHRGLDEGGT